MKMLNQITKGLGVLVLGLTLVACGSDSGSSIKTLKGTAATGAAIVGTVEAVGAGGNLATATIEADGTFKVKVNGMDAPFMLRTIASNGSASEYSYAEQANVTVNITPLTSMAMLVAAGNIDPSVMYNSWASSFGNITHAGIESAQATVNANLATQYAANNLDPLVYDFFGTEFDANHIGFDALLDSITVSVGNGVVTVNGVPLNDVIDISGYDIGGISNIGGTTDTGGTTGATGTYTMTVAGTINGFSVDNIVPPQEVPASAVPSTGNFSSVNPLVGLGALGDITIEIISESASQVVVRYQATITVDLPDIPITITSYDLIITYTQN